MTTLCYIEKDGAYLMLHRVKKTDDPNAGKWLGVGGHFEHGESPEECLVREVREETGLTLTRFRHRGVITFCFEDNPTEYMHLFTADGFEGELTDCDEGVLKWVDKDKIDALPMWEGDRVFFRLINEGREAFFSLKLVYHADHLTKAILDGESVPLPAKRAPELHQNGSEPI
ncbi:MAG: 8-oxo-dGTP diphosphatase [Clostridia bacterium]|nr:8-oxo-dGTP diphosphatase [Clostridia bacterium]